MIVLDTHVIIWSALDPSRLSPVAKQAIDQAKDQIIIADISIWEIAMLVKKGRLKIDVSSAQFVKLFLQSTRTAVQSITPEIAELSVSLDNFINSDPADRLIAATSVACNATLVTADKNLQASELIRSVW